MLHEKVVNYFVHDETVALKNVKQNGGQFEKAIEQTRGYPTTMSWVRIPNKNRRPAKAYVVSHGVLLCCQERRTLV